MICLDKMPTLQQESGTVYLRQMSMKYDVLNIAEIEDMGIGVCAWLNHI
jgi:hypothetical protein